MYKVLVLLTLISGHAFSAEHAEVISTYKCQLSDSSDRYDLVKEVTAIQYNRISDVLNRYKHHKVVDIPVMEGMDPSLCLDQAIKMQSQDQSI